MVEEVNVGDDAVGASSENRPGTVLKRAREAAKLSISEVAERTRIPIRQLESVERNEFGSLPGTPYAVGFSRAYARAVNVDEVEIARRVRAELDAGEPSERYQMFEPLDPARIPPRWLAWAAAGLAALLALGYGVWRAQLTTTPTTAELMEEAKAPAPATAARPGPAAPAQSGPVILTATSDVWLRIYDQNGERLLEKQMAKGEAYTVPASASNPMILTGRPDALAVTVGGKAVPPLGAPERTISDVPISASALLARAAPAATPAPAGTTAAPAPAPAPAAPARP